MGGLGRLGGLTEPSLQLMDEPLFGHGVGAMARPEAVAESTASLGEVGWRIGLMEPSPHLMDEPIFRYDVGAVALSRASASSISSQRGQAGLVPSLHLMDEPIVSIFGDGCTSPGGAHGASAVVAAVPLAGGLGTATAPPADTHDDHVLLPIENDRTQSPAGSVAATVKDSDDEASETDGRMNGSVSYGIAVRDEVEDSLVDAVRLDRQRAARRRSRSRDRDRDFAVWFPARESSVGEAFRNVLVGRPRDQGLALTSLLDGTVDFNDALVVVRRRVAQEVRRGVSFYFGITENPQRRFDEHLGGGGHWTSMLLLMQASSSSTTGGVERLLIDEFGQNLLCTNSARGGERASAGSPHYLYMLLGQSSLLRRSS
jgi:hypothetical protein